MALGYLLDPFIQIQNDNGTPIVGAKIYVYNADTTNLATTYNDFEGHLNTNPIITDDLGNATIIADDGIEYDISVHDENDLLLFTKKYISIDKTSSVGGTTQVAPGYGVSVERVGNVFTVSVDTDLIATKEDLNDKQDKLHAGDNIEITDDNTVNVVGRSELVVQEPLRLTREQNKLKLFVDNNIETLYKTVQTPAAYGGNTGNYISRIQQNPNGEITCEVSDLSDIAAYQAGDNITIVGHTINGRDWTPELNQKVDNSVYNAYVAEHLNDDNTPYTAGANINITNHVVSGKDWTSTINNAATTNGWDVTPYVAGTNIAIANHTINGKDWTSTINNAATTNEWDVTPYTAGNFIGITNHTIEGYNWSSYINDAATRNSWDVTPYTAGSNITISNHQISCTGDVTPYTAGTGISVYNHKISCTGDVTPYTAGTGISISNHTISCVEPVYFDSFNMPTRYTFVTLDSQYGTQSWLNVPDAMTSNGIVKNGNDHYSLVDQSSSKMCEVDADFVIKIDALPSQASDIDIIYGAKPDKSASLNTQRKITFYTTGTYYIHYHCIFSARDFYFCGANQSYLVGGGTASICLQNVSICSI